MIDNIADWWRNFFEHPTFWDAFWPSVIGALTGAATAFILENRYRRRERVGREVGQCNRLLFTLGQMLSTLEDVHELLFTGPRQSLGREPMWHEIGALPGAPKAGSEFVIGEYDFLLEDRASEREATAKALTRVYFIVSRFNSALALVAERTDLYEQWRRFGMQAQLGVEAAAAIMQRDVIGARVQQLTGMLLEDVPEAIGLFKEVIPQLREALALRYPRRQFIRLWPKNSDAPPV